MYFFCCMSASEPPQGSALVQDGPYLPPMDVESVRIDVWLDSITLEGRRKDCNYLMKGVC